MPRETGASFFWKRTFDYISFITSFLAREVLSFGFAQEPSLAELMGPAAE